MEVLRKGFPSILRDNDEIFLSKLIGATEAIDELCSMEITKTEHSYHFRIAPSTYSYMEPILYEILTFCNLFRIQLTLSKSMKASSTVTFSIELT